MHAYSKHMHHMQIKCVDAWYPVPPVMKSKLLVVAHSDKPATHIQADAGVCAGRQTLCGRPGPFPIFHKDKLILVAHMYQDHPLTYRQAQGYAQEGRLCVDAQCLLPHVVQGRAVQAEGDDLVHQHQVYADLLGGVEGQHAVHIACGTNAQKENIRGNLVRAAGCAGIICEEGGAVERMMLVFEHFQ